MRRCTPAAAAVVALSLASCSTGADSPDTASIRWAPCAPADAPAPGPVFGSDLRTTCATLDVPVDHDAAKGATLRMHLVRITRARPGDRPREPLLLVAGGPGESGVDYAPIAATLVPSPLLDRFDLVGFDERGTGRSDPIRCNHPERDRMRLPDLSTDPGFAAASARARATVGGCIERLGVRAPSYTTAAAARDMDLLRAALGVEKLTLVGWSYGAKLGGEYVDRFPERVRAAVLDAPTDPTIPWEQTVERQVAGFEETFGVVRRWCAARADCQSLGDLRTAVLDLAREADLSPVRSLRPGDEEPSTGWDVMSAVVTALYDEARWPHLVAALHEARAGDSGSVRELGELAFADEQVSDANFVINCNDSAARPTQVEVRAAAARFRESFPVFGAWGSWGLFGCGYWDVARHPLTPPDATTTTSVLVVGTIGDPATPYAGAQSMARGLGNARLLTYDGVGHTAFGRNACIGEHVRAYLTDLTVPPEGTRCPA